MALIHLTEDDPDLRELYRQALTPRGHQVVTAADLESGLTLLAQGRPDLVMTDLSLPDGSGLTLVRAAARRSIPVLIASANSEEHTFLQGSDSGAKDFLVKPFPLALLASKVERLLRSGGSSAEALLPGGRANAFGRFEILETVGRGGSGVVFRARDKTSDAEVALKVHSPRGHTGEGVERARSRFQREAYCLSSVQHRNLIGIHAHGTERGFDFIAMDFVRGETLGDYVQSRGPLSSEELRVLLRHLASGLIALHSLGLVHRDLKPENIMLRDGALDSPVIIDFGLTKLHFDRSLTLESERHGTPAFMSPEQIHGGRSTPQSDLFSLGLVGCFAASGHRAFPELGLNGLLLALTTRPVRVPEEVAPDLRDVLKGLTRISLERRTKSAEDLVDSLAVPA